MEYYLGEFFVFDDDETGHYVLPAEVFGETYGWFHFDDGWRYEHTLPVPVPYNLEPFGFGREDGPELFESGDISFDTRDGVLVWREDEEASLGSRYHGMDDTYLADKFEFGDAVIYVLSFN